jgi:hypothetical protein
MNDVLRSKLIGVLNDIAKPRELKPFMDVADDISNDQLCSFIDVLVEGAVKIDLYKHVCDMNLIYIKKEKFLKVCESYPLSKYEIKKFFGADVNEFDDATEWYPVDENGFEKHDMTLAIEAMKSVGTTFIDGSAPCFKIETVEQNQMSFTVIHYLEQVKFD